MKSPNICFLTQKYKKKRKFNPKNLVSTQARQVKRCNGVDKYRGDFANVNKDQHKSIEIDEQSAQKPVISPSTQLKKIIIVKSTR